MKKFLINLSNAFGILLGILLLKSIFLKPSISNELYVAKYENYLAKSLDDDYNTLFFGSSRIFRHVNPSLFDSLGNELNLSSYNLAAPATFNPELYHIYDRFLDDYESGIIPDTIEYVFIELQSINSLPLENALSKQGSYWNTPYYYLESLNQIYDLNRRSAEKIRLLFNYSASLINNFLSVYPELISHENVQDLGDYGYMSLEYEIDKYNDIDLIKRREEFIESPERLNLRIEDLKNTSINDLMGEPLNRSLDRRVNELLAKSSALDIRLYFIIAPRQNIRVYKDLAPILKNNSDHVLELVSIEKFPELYMFEHSFDVGHLNDKGVKFFTSYLSREFIEFESN